jgi:putative nucleotidyltransferase with HDIG domain
MSDMISVDLLKVGMYIHLDVSWISHPFSLNAFKIKSEDQIRTIRGLGVKEIRWDPTKSDLSPAPGEPGGSPADESLGQASPQEKQALEAKRIRVEILHKQREKMSQMEEAFSSAAAIVRSINKKIFSQPKETIEETRRLVDKMVESFLAAPEVAIHIMGEKLGEEVYCHSLNVAILSMMIARELKLPPEVINTLGSGSLFHDIGLTEVSPTIINKTDPLTKIERNFREMHCEYGLDIGKKIGLPPPVLKIIYQHHELFDGSGYPKKLEGEAIDLLARIVVIANHYDNLCNPPSILNALTPHEALSQMFAQYRAKFDQKLLQLFIRCMGVYPPGTIVKLSNEAIGLVTAVNASKPLKPMMIIFDPKVPKNEAIILDLEQEPGINISKAIRPALLSRAAYEYLSPRKRVNYYFDADAGRDRKFA